MALEYVEVYNETVNDLLKRRNCNLELKLDAIQGVVIKGLTTVQVKTKEEAYKLFLQGEAERRFAETKMNHTSSRSHCIFRIHLQVPTSSQSVKLRSSINLIDLAGSEGVGKSDTEGERLREGALINKSLLSVYNVISKLSKGDSFVCFRESKLTRILQPCLGGNSLTAIINTVSPSQSNLQESLNTLRFGLCAGGVKNNVAVNVQDSSKPISLDSFRDEINKLIEERDSLAREVESTQNLAMAAEADFEAKMLELEQVLESQQQALILQRDIASLRQKKKEIIKEAELEIANKKKQIEISQKELEELNNLSDKGYLESEK